MMRPVKKGFTLIELLVVISILALLLAVVMPALTLAKYKAKKLLCRSNMHQWGIVSNVYANDWDDALPRQDIWTGVGGNVWDISLAFLSASGKYIDPKTNQEANSVMSEYGLSDDR